MDGMANQLLARFGIIIVLSSWRKLGQPYYLIPPCAAGYECPYDLLGPDYQVSC
jgi:hypothetical protein